METKNVLSISLFAITFLITLWIWALLAKISWVPVPFSGGSGMGAAIIFLMTAARLLAMSITFIFLLIDGRLDGWSRYWILRLLLAFGGIMVLEGCMFAVYIRCVDDSVSPTLHLLFKTLVILLPVMVMAGGYFGSRLLFFAGVVASLAAAVWPLSK
jgi:hypothetical protein